jgi:hypothetical protein
VVRIKVTSITFYSYLLGYTVFVIGANICRKILQSFNVIAGTTANTIISTTEIITPSTLSQLTPPLTGAVD